MAAEAIGFTGETAVLDGNTLLALSIQFASEQLALKFLDDGRELRFQSVDVCRCPFTN